MARAGFTNHVIATMKAEVGDKYIEGALQRLEAEATNPAALGLGIHQYRHEPVVYYMRMDRLVKIGTTTNIAMRTGTIMPQGVLAVEWGARARERDRHAQFIDFHSHGEWYWMREPLWEHIQHLREQAPAALGVSVEDWLAGRGVRYGQLPTYEEGE